MTKTRGVVVVDLGTSEFVTELEISASNALFKKVPILRRYNVKFQRQGAS
jgi:hypothetical protein